MIKTLGLFFLAIASATAQTTYTVTELPLGAPVALQGSMPMTMSMPCSLCDPTMSPPLPALTVTAQNHAGAMVGQLVYGSIAEGLIWADSTHYVQLSTSDYQVMGASQIGDDGSITGYGLAPDSATNWDFRTLVLTPPAAAQVASLQSVNAQLTTELQIANSALISQVSALQRQLSMLQVQNATLQSQLTTVQNQLLTVQRSMNYWASQAKSLTTQLATAQTQVRVLKATVSLCRAHKPC